MKDLVRFTSAGEIWLRRSSSRRGGRGDRRKEEDQEEIKKEYKKRNIEETEKESSLQRSGKPSRLEAKKERKQEREELDAINARLHEYANTSSSPTVNLSLPPWKVKPEGGEES